MEADNKLDALRLKRAYGSYAFLGLAALPVGVAELLGIMGSNFDEGSGGLGEKLAGWIMFFAILFGLPFSMVVIITAIYGLWQTIRFKHSRLVFLAAISVICVGGVIAIEPHTSGWTGKPGHAPLDYLVLTLMISYIAANILIPGWWFAVRRQLRLRSAPVEK